MKTVIYLVFLVSIGLQFILCTEQTVLFQRLVGYFNKKTTNQDKYKDFNISNLKGKIIQFADINYDQFTDLLVHEENKNTDDNIIIYLWNNINSIYEESIQVKTDKNLISVLVGDFSGNGFNDIIGLFKSKKKCYYMILYNYNPIGNTYQEKWSNKNDFMSSEPLLFDFNGDNQIDFLFEKIENNQNIRYLYINKGNNTFELVQWSSMSNSFIFEDVDSENKYVYNKNAKNYLENREILEKHYSGFVDIDGDCRADIVLHVKDEYNNEFLEIWLNRIVDGKVKYKKYEKEISLPNHLNNIFYFDFNGDGTNDILITLCRKDNYKNCISHSRIVFVPNIQDNKICKSLSIIERFYPNKKHLEKTSEPKCLESSDLCTPSNFSIHSFNNEDEQIIFQDIENFDLNGKYKSLLSLLTPNLEYKNFSNSDYSEEFKGYTVSALLDTVSLSNSNENNNQGDTNNKDYSNKNQIKSISDQLVSFFNSLTNKKHSKIVELQWADTFISIGDRNLDGYYDILAIVKTYNDEMQVRVINNVFLDRSHNEMNKLNSDSNKTNQKMSLVNKYSETKATLLYYFQLFVKYIESFYKVDNSVNSDINRLYRYFVLDEVIVRSKEGFGKSYFIDFYDDGNLDILTLSNKKENGLVETSVNISNYDKTALFLKINILNSDKKKGTLLYGATAKITITDINGVKSQRIATQLSQTTSGIIHYPYVLFGLGKTNNYIEELFIGTSSISKYDLDNSSDSILSNIISIFATRKHLKSIYSNLWMGIIPNTHVIAHIYPLLKPFNWYLVLSISPTKSLGTILMVITTALAVIGIIVVILDRREKFEDMKEHQGFKHHFISA